MPPTSREDASADRDSEACPYSSDQESDVDHGQATDIDYSSFKPRECDRALLEEEEERENLLTVGGRDRGDRGRVKIGNAESRKKNRRRKQARKRKIPGNKDGAGESMYEMEEGGGREDTSSLSSSSSAELGRLKYNYSSTSKVRFLSSLPGNPEAEE